MFIKEFVTPDKQMSRIGNHSWSVARLIELARKLPVMYIPLEHLNMNYSYSDLTLRELVGHMVAVNKAKLNYPIILDEDGDIMDGRHRLMQAIIKGEKTIKAVRFKENPSPCEIRD
jgi:hypothetical protein